MTTRAPPSRSSAIDRAGAVAQGRDRAPRRRGAAAGALERLADAGGLADDLEAVGRLEHAAHAARTIWWSSTRRTRITRRHRVSKRKRAPPPAGRRASTRPPTMRRSLDHALDAVADVPGPTPVAVVLDRDEQLVAEDRGGHARVRAPAWRRRSRGPPGRSARWRWRSAGSRSRPRRARRCIASPLRRPIVCAQALEGGAEPEIVEHLRPQVGDQVAHVLDRGRHALARLVQPLGVARVARARARAARAKDPRRARRRFDRAGPGRSAGARAPGSRSRAQRLAPGRRRSGLAQPRERLGAGALARSARRADGDRGEGATPRSSRRRSSNSAPSSRVDAQDDRRELVADDDRLAMTSWPARRLAGREARQPAWPSRPSTRIAYAGQHHGPANESSSSDRRTSNFSAPGPRRPS